MSADLVTVGETMWTFATADLAPLAAATRHETMACGAESNVAVGSPGSAFAHAGSGRRRRRVRPRRRQ